MKRSALRSRPGTVLGIVFGAGGIAAGLVLGAAAVALGAAAAKPADERFSAATEVVAVEVPVQVLRDGQPVRGLTAADFEIYEGRQKQPITGFEVLDLTTTPAAAPAAGRPAPAVAAAPLSARRRFVLLFDLSFSSSASLVKSRQAAKDLLHGLDPSDLVAVASYSSTRGPQLLLNFTADHKQAAAVLADLGYVTQAADPLRLTLPAMMAGGGGGGSGERGGRRGEGGGADGSGGGGDVVDQTAALLNAAADRDARTVQQRDIIAFSRATAAFAKMLGSVHGRKYVVYLSEGFDNQLLLGSQDDAEIQAMNEASANGEIWKVDSDKRYGNTRLSGDVGKMIEELRRADCVVEAVDPGGLRAFGGDNGIKPGSGQDSLFMIADGTGGELYRNFNDLSQAMHEMLTKTSVTYVLTYQPEGVPHDGTYRKLRVELKNAPRGTRVVYRPGYYAPLPYDRQTPLERQLDTASQVIGGRSGGAIATSVLAAPFAAPGDKAYVPVLIEIDGKSLLAGRPAAGAPLPLEIYTYALDGAGTVQDYFAKTLALDLAKVEPVLQKSGLKFYGDLRLPVGTYSLRVMVRNGATGAAGLRVVALEVPAFARATPVLLTPFFPEPAGKWLIVRKSNEAPKDVPYPFLAQRQPYVPAALPVLRAGEPAAMALVGYHLQPGELKVDGRILTADGREAGQGQVKLVERQSGSAAEPDRLSATFRPPALSPGEYVLLVTLTDAAGAAETSTASFVVAKGVGG